MTYDEIVRALQCCSFGCRCEGCPARHDKDCLDHVCVLAAEAIGRLSVDNAALRYAAASGKAHRESVPYLREWVKQLSSQGDHMVAENALLRAQIPQWRSVGEELPPAGQRVLATDGALVYIGMRRKSEDSWILHGLWGVSNAAGNCVTHWMPTPDLPKED